MATITAPGIGSNLDVNSIVSQLMAVERQPLDVLDRKEASYQAQLSAFGSIKGALASFQGAVAGLKSPAQFLGYKAAVADGSVATASAGSGASPGTYSVEVQALAQAHKLKSTAFAATTDALGSGTLTIQFGTYAGGAFTANAERGAATIAIPAGASTLAGVRDAINAARAGVSASIVNDGSGNRLVIASSHAGMANALRITVADDDGNPADATGLSALAYDASTGGVANLAQTVAAQNATVVIDGIAVSKASNTIADAIEGVTLTLAKTNPGDPTSLVVSRDAASARSAVERFVKAYNELGGALRELSGYDAATKQGGVLLGDATVRTIQSRLRNLLNTRLDPAPGGLSSLTDIGVAFQRDGTLKLDAAKLDAALADGTKDVASLFAAVGKPSDSLVTFAGATAAAKAGRYALDVTQVATRGFAGASAAAGLTIGAGTNDTIALTVDGTAATVTLTAGAYTPATLAAELQSRVNGALAAAGKSVVVGETAGVLAVTSASYGAGSSVALTGGNGLAGLFGTPAATAGVDGAGTLGALAATASGRTLSARGLTVRIDGGAAGTRGTVTFARGYAEQLDALVGDLLASDGAVAGRTQGIDASIKDIAGRRATLERRMVAIEARLRAQFVALDTMISSMNQTSAYLTQQLANLPGSSTKE